MQLLLILIINIQYWMIIHSYVCLILALETEILYNLHYNCIATHVALGATYQCSKCNEQKQTQLNPAEMFALDDTHASSVCLYPATAW